MKPICGWSSSDRCHDHICLLLTSSCRSIHTHTRKHGNIAWRDNNYLALFLSPDGSISQMLRVNEPELMLHALGGFLLYINRKGRILYVSENVSTHLGFNQVWQNKTRSIYKTNILRQSHSVVISLNQRQTIKWNIWLVLLLYWQCSGDCIKWLYYWLLLVMWCAQKLVFVFLLFNGVIASV